MDSTAVIYVVFGIEKIDRSQVTREHVLENNKVVHERASTRMGDFFCQS